MDKFVGCGLSAGKRFFVRRKAGKCTYSRGWVELCQQINVFFPLFIGVGSYGLGAGDNGFNVIRFISGYSTNVRTN